MSKDASQTKAETAYGNRRLTMKLFAGVNDLQSHRVRLVLAEKDLEYTLNYVQSDGRDQEHLAELNPYGTVPTLCDREAVVYPAHLITEYLDERFPHPALLPPSPSERAHARLLIYRIERDWYSQVKRILTGDKNAQSAARKILNNSLTSLAPVFKESKFFLSDFSLVDCAMAPMLWRLKSLKIELPHQAGSVLKYAARLFERPAFQACLNDVERKLNP